MKVNKIIQTAEQPHDIVRLHKEIRIEKIYIGSIGDDLKLCPPVLLPSFSGRIGFNRSG